MKLAKNLIIIILFCSPIIVWSREVCDKHNPNPLLNGQIKISEIRPSDIGNDNGWTGLKNVSDDCLNLAGWVLYDGNLEHELFITPENSEGFYQGLLLAPGAETKVFLKGDQDFALDAGGGKIEIYSGPAEMLGIVQDSVSYSKIDKGESYRVLPKGNSSSAQVVTDSEEHSYQIPEDTNQESRVANHEENKSEKNNKDSENLEGDGLGNNSEVLVGAGESQKERIQQNNSPNKESDPDLFLASTGNEKSPWRWGYFLWGSWFIWRIILPFLVLWGGLYCLAYLVRRKYLS